MKLTIALLGLFLAVSAKANQVPNCGNVVAQRSFGQVIQELHGGNPLNPTPESLLGRFIAQSGARVGVQRFNNGTGGQGAEKLVVPVSPSSIALYQQMFGYQYANAFEHLHTPGQGTLIMRWMNQVISYARASGEWRFPQVGSIGPTIILADSEARRLQSYLELNALNNNMRMPNSIPGYGYPADAYIGNCTAWIGHIPLGDNTQNEVVVPGCIDQYGDRAGAEPRRGILQGYNDLQGIDNNLLRQVWNPNLNTRLFDVLGIPFELANHTNPGWVAISLTAQANPERVPFVVAYVQDHQNVNYPIDPLIRAVGP